MEKNRRSRKNISKKVLEFMQYAMGSNPESINYVNEYGYDESQFMALVDASYETLSSMDSVQDMMDHVFTEDWNMKRFEHSFTEMDPETLEPLKSKDLETAKQFQEHGGVLPRQEFKNHEPLKSGNTESEKEESEPEAWWMSDEDAHVFRLKLSDIRNDLFDIKNIFRNYKGNYMTEEIMNTIDTITGDFLEILFDFDDKQSSRNHFVMPSDDYFTDLDKSINDRLNRIQERIRQTREANTPKNVVEEIRERARQALSHNSDQEETEMSESKHCENSETERYEMPKHGKLEQCGAPENEKYEMVDHPSHYNSSSIETIEKMVRIWGRYDTAKWCEMTAFKYRDRIGNKPGNSLEQEVGKIKWYEAKAKQLTMIDDGCNTCSQE